MFHAFPAVLPSDATFSVLPWREELSDSLEFAAYADQVSEILRAKGLTVEQAGRPAKYAVFLDYGIDDGRTETASYSLPNWGVTGYSSARTTGTITSSGNTSYLNATTTATPTYGITGYNQVTQSARVYTRFVKLDIVEVNAATGTSKKVYEGTLKSDGSCGNLAVVMPTLFAAMFEEFPGKSGSARTVSLPLQGDC